MRGCTAGVGDFVEWTCDVHMRHEGDTSVQEAILNGGGEGAGAMTLMLLLVLGIVVGGGVSFAIYKLKVPEANPRRKLSDGPDTPGNEMANMNGDNDNDL